jgi:hypothetical protein
MTRFKITVRRTDNTTEITTEARQPMPEILMHTPSGSSYGATPLNERGTVDSYLVLIIRPIGTAHRAAVLSLAQASWG